MFEKSLKDKLKAIFDFDKVTFDLASVSKEQEGIFINVEKALSVIKEKRQYCRVNGKLSVFANADKLPYGYFAKKIQEADLDLTHDLFFFDLEENAGQFQNIVERSLSFIYFYNSQYDPAVGIINEVNFQVVAE